MTEPTAPGWYPIEDGTTRFWDGDAWSDRPFPRAQPDRPPSAPTAHVAPPAPATSFWQALHRSGLHRYLIALAVIVVGAVAWIVIANHHDGPSTAAGARAGKGFGLVYKTASGQLPDPNGLHLQCDLMADMAQAGGDPSSDLPAGAVNKDDFINACVTAATDG